MERTSDLAIDSELRGCDVVKAKIGDLVSGGRVRSPATIIQPLQLRRSIQSLLLNSEA